MSMKENVLASKMVIRVAKVDVVQAIIRYKASEVFEDDISETICDAFYKGFDKCKKKVALTFDHLDLHDIVLDNPEGDGSSPSESIIGAALASTTSNPQQEMGTLIDAIMEAYESSGVLPLGP